VDGQGEGERRRYVNIDRRLEYNDWGQVIGVIVESRMLPNFLCHQWLQLCTMELPQTPCLTHNLRIVFWKARSFASCEPAAAGRPVRG